MTAPIEAGRNSAELTLIAIEEADILELVQGEYASAVASLDRARAPVPLPSEDIERVRFELACFIGFLAMGQAHKYVPTKRTLFRSRPDDSAIGDFTRAAITELVTRLQPSMPAVQRSAVDRTAEVRAFLGLGPIAEVEEISVQKRLGEYSSSRTDVEKLVELFAIRMSEAVPPMGRPAMKMVAGTAAEAAFDVSQTVIQYAFGE